MNTKKNENMAPKKTSKFERLIVHAIKKLQDIQGSTSKEISNYLAQEYDVPSEEIKKQVRLALSRGVDYGILQCKKGGFYTCNSDYLTETSARRGDNQAGECSAAYNRWKKSRGRRGRRSKSGKRRSGRRRKSSRGRKRSRGAKRSGRSRKRGGRRGRKRSRSGGKRRRGRKSRGCH